MIRTQAHVSTSIFGTGQSTLVWDHPGQRVTGRGDMVIAGYGGVGRGVATRAKGMVATVIVTEIDPLKAIEGGHDGFMVMRWESGLRWVAYITVRDLN